MAQMTHATTDPFAELPTAQDLMKQIVLQEAEKASSMVRERTAAEAEKDALLEKLSKPSGVSDEERMRRAGAVIKRAVNNGSTESSSSAFQISSAPITDAPSISRSLAGRTR